MNARRGGGAGGGEKKEGVLRKKMVINILFTFLIMDELDLNNVNYSSWVSG